MNLYKLHNIARRTIKVKPGEKLYTKKYSVQYLNSLAEQYEMREFLELRYCCRGEDHNCWIDVEGIDYGWLWIDKKPEEMPKLLFEMALGALKASRKTLYQRKIYVLESDNAIQLYVFVRDVAKCDYVLSFAKRTDVESVGMFD